MSCIHSILFLGDIVNAEDLKEGLSFKYGPWTHDAQWKEGMNYFCWHENDCIDCYIESWRSVVKVEPWNMSRPWRNLQLQIVWNWLGVLVLFGRLTAIGSIYLLKTTKVSGNTERGSRTVIFLLFTFFLCLGLSVSKAGTRIRGSFRDFRIYFWWCYDDGHNMPIFERHPNSKSLVLYPEALCTQAWTQMNSMAVFNEDIFTAVGHDGFTDI